MTLKYRRVFAEIVQSVTWGSAEKQYRKIFVQYT